MHPSCVLDLLQHARFCSHRNPCSRRVLTAVGINADLSMKPEVMIGAVTVSRSITGNQIA